MGVEIPRIMLAAPASGAGKTTLACALLQALVDAGHVPAAFKCGPDYIDPLFHRRIVGTASGNLDLFFTDGQRARELLARGAAGCDIAVLEGVMGYYDGVTGAGTRGSSYHVARATQSPVVLVLQTRGAALSLAALVKGFAEFRADANIRGVILNKCTRRGYEAAKECIERETGVEVLGYVPDDARFAIESRHLGLVTADETADLKRKVALLAHALRESVALERLVQLARSAPALDARPYRCEPLDETRGLSLAYARDEAFCFYYEENLRMLEDLGVRLVPFSPLADEPLPRGVAGLYLGGGYPELHCQRLAASGRSRASVHAAVRAGLPTIAECGGFMYLQQSIEDADGTSWPMAGVLPGASRNAGRLGNFGYARATAVRDTMLLPCGQSVNVHEFHYWASSEEGDALHAEKANGTGWECMVCTPSLQAGYPHIYYPGNPAMLRRFVRAMAAWRGGAGEGAGACTEGAGG